MFHNEKLTAHNTAQAKKLRAQSRMSHKMSTFVNYNIYNYSAQKVCESQLREQVSLEAPPESQRIVSNEEDHSTEREQH
jgi:hypothetical protein